MEGLSKKDPPKRWVNPREAVVFEDLWLKNIKKTQVISLELQNAELVKALRLRGAAPSSDSVVRLHEFHEASHMRHHGGNMESSWKWWFPIVAREPKKHVKFHGLFFSKVCTDRGLQGIYVWVIPSSGFSNFWKRTSTTHCAEMALKNPYNFLDMDDLFPP